MKKQIDICQHCEQLRIDQLDMNQWCILDNYDIQTDCSDDKAMSEGMFTDTVPPNECKYQLEHTVLLQESVTTVHLA